jgi:hypothetical protein
MMRHGRTWILVSTLLVLATVAAGCGDAIAYGCNYPIVGRLAHDGRHDACCDIDPCPGVCLNDPCPDGGEGGDAGTDATMAEDGTSSCAGECAPIPPFGWDGPGLLWLGADGTAPPCPDQAPVVAYQGHADLVAPPAACGSCICSPSTGTCAPPPSLSASSKACGDSSGIITPFGGPMAWDGACTAHDCISSDPACAHAATIACVTASPLAMTEEGCTPSIITTNDPSQPSWMTEALACRGSTYPLGGCPAHDETCAPSAAPPDFLMCVYQAGDVACPNSYPDKHLVFAAFDDQRDCTACTCGAPVGGACQATLSVFKDAACTSAMPAVGSLSSLGPTLIPVSLPLAGKTVTALGYQPGTCAPSGGEPSGSVQAAGPSTFCCLMS